MTTDTEKQKASYSSETTSESGNKPSALDWATLGCLLAGAAGIIKAFMMDNASAPLYLFGSVLAFAGVIYAHRRKSEAK